MPRHRTFAAIACAAALACGTPVSAQTAPDAVGDWHGSLTTPAGTLTLILTVTQDDTGALAAELESPDQAPGQKIPVTEIAVAEGAMEFRIARIGASYAGKWDAADHQWQGTFSQGAKLPLNLSPGLPGAKAVVAGMDGTWEGSMRLNGTDLRLVLRVRTTDQGTTALLDSPDQMATGLPVQGFAREGDTVRFTIASGNQTYRAQLAPDGRSMDGTWSSPLIKNDLSVSFTRTGESAERREVPRPQTPQPPFPYRAEQVEIDNPVQPQMHLAGTLTLPEGDGPFPAAVLITGSGPQDRDETIMGHKPFAVIADALTRRGIAVLRYDDRGVGGSTGEFANATSADFATDANAAVAFLKTRAEIDPAAIGFIGHSEGGIVGPVAMADNPDAAFLVMLAGPGTALDTLLLSQRRLVGAQMGMSEAAMDRAEPILASVFAAIADAPSHADGVVAARELLTPEAMTAIGAPGADPDTILSQIATPWFRYFLNYDAAAYLARIKVPVLALNGTLDRQVPPQENLAAIRAALAENPDATTLELPGLNHLFQTAKTGAVGEYGDIQQTIAAEVLTIMGNWILERFGKLD